MIKPLSFLCAMLVVFALHPCGAQSAETTKGEPTPKARYRVIVDNDFGGDPDGLFQLAHHLLSPSVEVRGIIGSHQYPEGFYGYPGNPENAVAQANEVLAAMNLTGKVPVYAGANERIIKTDTPVKSPGAEFIVREAMRDEVKSPLFIACGAGLTDLASAYLIEPRIAKRICLIWIGGHEHDGLAVPPPNGQRVEYNLGIDLKAGQIVFNQSDIPIWQVPRDAYRQALVSYAELRQRMGQGKLATHLRARLGDLLQRGHYSLGETYVLGDSPLVLLTALQSGWEADPSSSRYVLMPAPGIADSGLYQPNPQGRKIRVYTQLDNRLMFEDFYAKVGAFDHAGEAKD